jgi:hypothetical protein
MIYREDFVKQEITDCAGGAVNWALSATTSTAAVITRSVLLLAISLAFALVAIVMPIAHLMISVNGLLKRSGRKITTRLRRHETGTN